MVKKRPKGEHKEAMEKAKRLLREHVGMPEIVERTDLTIDEINKAKDKI